MNQELPSFGELGRLLGVSPKRAVEYGLKNFSTLSDEVSTEAAIYHQLMGIAYRLAKDAPLSKMHFERAIGVAKEIGDDVLRARCLRDYAMIPIEALSQKHLPDPQRQFLRDFAEDMLNESVFILEDANLAQEVAASLDFLGRLELAVGNKKKALSQFKKVDSILRGQDDRDDRDNQDSPNWNYVLNNMAQLARASGFRGIYYLPDLVILIFKTGQYRRLLGPFG